MPTVTTTYLEMRSPSDLRPKQIADEHFWISEATMRQWQLNRFFYLTVGEPWNWSDKRNWSDEQWREYAEAPQQRLFAAYWDGSPVGYYELCRHDDDSVEIEYFGLMPAFVGRGLGGRCLPVPLKTPGGCSRRASGSTPAASTIRRHWRIIKRGECKSTG
jgi:RimJ/RimL family protein N-acetyltransferase